MIRYIVSKRKLNKQQQSRIKRNQARDITVASNHADTNTEQGLGPKSFGLVITRHAKHAEIEDETGHRLICKIRQNIGSLTAGDRVVFQTCHLTDDGIVTSRLKRESELGRGDKKGQIRPVAANVDQILIVIASKPAITPVLLDSYLIAAENLNITPIIIYNKIDLGVNTDLVQYYQEIGYSILMTSTLDNQGIETLIKTTQDKMSVFVGQSGVGKSSLISTLLPDEHIRSQAISSQSELGKHTTSNSTVYHLPRGGSLIDSPGIREFGLWHLEKEQIMQGFIEFQALLGHCKYKNCSHCQEPGCVIIEAAKSPFAKERLKSLQYLLNKH